MKSRLTFKNLFIKLSFAVFILTLSNESIAQEQTSSGVKNFKIKIEKTDKGLKMQSLKGSAWVNLSFNLANGKPEMIDEYGMTQLNQVSTDKDANLADYLFTITKTKNGLKLTGLEGTAWKELSFTLAKGGQQTIDQLGMTE